MRLPLWPALKQAPETKNTVLIFGVGVGIKINGVAGVFIAPDEQTLNSMTNDAIGQDAKIIFEVQARLTKP